MAASVGEERTEKKLEETVESGLDRSAESIV